jgi:tetratricopeptide (TPR) repeat protein
MDSYRGRLELGVLLLGVLLLGLAPYPRAFTAAIRQAGVHRANRDYGAALEAYQQAASLAPASPLPWLGMGEVLLGQHRFAEADTAFQQARWLGAGTLALLGQGDSYAGLGDSAAALGAWLAALALAPADARVYVALGRGAIAQGQFDLAKHFLAKALRLKPSADRTASAHDLLGCLLVGDDPDAAASHFRQAGNEEWLAILDAARAESDPARRALLLGAAFLQRDELTLARYHYERALALSTSASAAEARAYLGHVLDRLGNAVAAEEMLQQALDLDPDSVLARYFLGLHLRQVGNVTGAQAILWEAMQRDPENAALRAEMSEAFLDLGDYSHAEEWLQGAVEVAPQDIEFHLLLVHFYLDHLYRVEEGGLPAAQAAVALAPGDARAQDLLGWAYQLAGRVGDGRQALDRALALDPDLVSAHYHLGSLYLSIGQRDLARQHLQRAADLDIEGYYRSRAEVLLWNLK